MQIMKAGRIRIEKVVAVTHMGETVGEGLLAAIVIAATEGRTVEVTMNQVTYTITPGKLIEAAEAMQGKPEP